MEQFKKIWKIISVVSTEIFKRLLALAIIVMSGSVFLLVYSTIDDLNNAKHKAVIGYGFILILILILKRRYKDIDELIFYNDILKLFHEDVKVSELLKMFTKWAVYNTVALLAASYAKSYHKEYFKQ